MNFTFLTGDINWQDFGGKFISKKLNNGGSDFWYIIDVTNMKDACGSDAEYTYSVSLNMVSPDEASEESRESALSFIGEDRKWDELEWYDQVEALTSYGTYANMETFSGNNIKKLMQEARQAARDLEPEKDLESPANQIGSTKRDFLKGDILAGMRRYDAEKEVTKAVVSKQNGITTMDQSKLTSDCFLIQMQGISACESCEYKNTDECGGKVLREKILTA